tara:strand:+ start:476 stop:1771 length:1296 start_codon:yes stop_codon:yes gene_type:complete
LTILEKNISPLEKTLYYLVIFFPIFFFFRSFILNFITISTSLLFLILSIKIKYNFLNKKYNILLLIFFLYIFLQNLILNKDIEVLIKTIFLFKFFLIFNAIIFVYSRVDKEFIKKNLIYLFFFILIILLDFLKQYFTGTNFIGLKGSFCNYTTDQCQRFSGFFGSELIFGGYFSTIIFSSFILFKIFFKNNAINIFAILIPIIVFLSGERSALLLSLALTIVFYLNIIEFNLKNFFSVLLILISSIIFINFAVKDSTKERYYSDIKKLIILGQPNFIETLKLTPWGLHYNAGAQMVSEKPIFGNGFKSFRIKCKNYETKKISELTRYKVCSTHPHNYNLEILIDTGLIGFSIFISFVFYLLRDFKINESKKDTLCKVIFYFIVVFIFLPRPTGSIFSTYFGIIYWYFLGSLLGFSKLLITDKRMSKTYLNK